MTEMTDYTEADVRVWAEAHALILRLAERIYLQHELLSRRAEK